MRRLFRQFSFREASPATSHPRRRARSTKGASSGTRSPTPTGVIRQPGADRGVRGGRRRGRNWPSRDELALEQVPEPARDGAVLPILHLNGYKIAGPTVLARIPHEELRALFAGYGYEPYFVEGSEPAKVHQLMAATLDAAVADIKAIQREARTRGFRKRAAGR